jgi:predicted ATPase/DNA-binding SARP family transcriptional activator
LLPLPGQRAQRACSWQENELARLNLSLLGPLEVTLDGETVTLKTDKVRALLAYLAVEAERPHRREALCGLFWPEQPDRAARASLRNALYLLRTAIGDRGATSDGGATKERGEPHLLVERETVQFNAESDHWLDVRAFESLSGAGDGEEAVALYRGGFLEGFALGDSVAFEDWALLVRERLRREVLEVLRRLVERLERRGEVDRACDYAWRAVELEPWQEEFHRQLMRLLALSGRRSAALAQYEACRRLLEEELGVEPGGETTQLYQRIRDGADLRPLSALPQHNLPAQLSPLIGREDLLSQIEARLGESTCRLLTLVGPGGSGKTRLALEVAARQVDGYRDGVFFVPLAPLRTVDAIVPAIAQAMGLTLAGGRDPRRQLLNGLRRKEMLLVLDNVEHLLVPPDGGDEEGGAAALITEILRAAPDLQIVATSRFALNVQGECLYPISGMAVPPLFASSGGSGPDDGHGREREERPPLDAVREAASYSAVQLFASSARRVRPDFELAAENVADVVHICRLVAGMPLGILLATTWLKMLTPAEIVDQIAGDLAQGDAGLDFLETDLRDVPARQRSMRAVFDHSWCLLSAREQEILARLSVFHGGFTAQAAQAVAGAGLRALMGLVSHSLVQRDQDGRYEMHELLRQYTEERLGATPGERERARDLHGAYYAGFLHQREFDVFRGHVQEVLREIDNIRAGWHWVVRHGKAAEILKSSPSLWLVYNSMYWRYEGEATFGQAAESLRGKDTGVPAETTEIALGLALAIRGFFARYLDDAERAASLVRESLSLLNKHGVRRELALGEWLAAYCLSQDDPQRWQLFQESLSHSQETGFYLGTVLALRALGRHEEALRISREADDRRGMALALLGLGNRAHARQEYARARQLYEESLALFQEVGIQWAIGEVSSLLGDVALALGDYGAARVRYWQAHDQCTRIGHDLCVLRALAGLGNVAQAVGDRVAAMRTYRQALESAIEVQADPFVEGTACRLDVVAGWAAVLASTDGEQAAELAALSRHHPSSTEETQEKAQRLLEGLRAGLSTAAYDTAVERGLARDLEATVNELLAELEAT